MWPQPRPSHRQIQGRARLEALRRSRGSEEELGQLIHEELDRSPSSYQFNTTSDRRGFDSNYSLRVAAVSGIGCTFLRSMNSFIINAYE
jgi:hypothetical protein